MPNSFLESVPCRGGFRDKPTGNTDNSEAKPALNNVDEYINRAIALGLLEVSPDESLRVPRILPLKLPEDAETLHRQAAEVLYRLWWKDAEKISEEQELQILNLALEGKAENIVIKIVINFFYKSLGNVVGMGMGMGMGMGRTVKLLESLIVGRKKQSMEILQRFQFPEAEEVRQIIAIVQKILDEMVDEKQ
jgi:hypothetical protein